MTSALITVERKKLHAQLLASILTRNSKGIPSNADSSSKVSCAIASSLIDRLGGAAVDDRAAGQSAGAQFERMVAEYLEHTFIKLGHLRPGQFAVAVGGGIAHFDQYAHLSELEKISKANKELATAIGSDYLVKPDVLVSRTPEADETLNSEGLIVDQETAKLTSLRLATNPNQILHASISCKWTLRSDRAQNARSEGLNLVRNRKGRLPHIAVVTGEPMPSRIASLALGTGDIDCVYHFALDELRAAVVDLGKDDTLELLETMIEGKRLRDISDLPLDLVV